MVIRGRGEADDFSVSDKVRLLKWIQGGRKDEKQPSSSYTVTAEESRTERQIYDKFVKILSLIKKSISLSFFSAKTTEYVPCSRSKSLFPGDYMDEIRRCQSRIILL
jgi:hypothetical protein